MEEKKKVEKVVRGQAKARKKTEMHKIKDAFFATDSTSFKSHFLYDVIIPNAKRIFLDTLSELLGEKRTTRSGTNAGRVSYRSYYEDRDKDRYRTQARSSVRYDYDDIAFTSRGDAEEVLSRMDELLEQYGQVTVADLYDLAGLTGDYTDNKYGWLNLASADVIRVSGGDYIIKLPRAQALK